MKLFRITILLTVLMSMFGAKAFAYDIEVSNKDGVTIWYNFIGETELAVTYQSTSYYSNEYSGNVVIPESVDYGGNTYSVTSIGESAFRDCSNLTSVTIPNSVSHIGSFAFDNTAWYKNQPDGLVYAGKVVYKYKGEMPTNTAITLEDGTLGIAEEAFRDCSSLTSVTIPNSVTSIGSSAFMDCSGLTSVTIPNSVTSIGHSTFRGCSSLTSVTIGNSVTSIDDYAFYNCSGLTSLTIPSSVTSIWHNVFEGCSGLTSVIVQCCPTTIGSGRFRGCSNLKEVTFDCETVTSLFVYSSIEKVTMKESVTSIGDSAFEGCTSLTSVTIPNSVTSIGGSAFERCTGLTSVTIPNSVTSIGGSAFERCTGLTSVTIPNSVTSIDYDTFSGCSGLTSVVIGSGVTSIGGAAFSDTNLKKTIWLTNTPPAGAKNAQGAINYVANDEYNISNKVVYPFLSSYFDVDGVRYVPVSLSDKTCDAIDCTYEKSIENIQIASTVVYKGISMSVKEIQPYIGYSNKYIKSLTLSNNGDVGEHAFANCSSMETVNVSNIGSIGKDAFANCSSMVTANISNTGPIGKSAFSNCSSMVTANISNTGAIDNDAFKNCSSLETVDISNTDSIRNYAFAECSKLKSLKLGNSVSGIGSYTFQGCSSLESVTIPNLVETINEYTFVDCSALNTVIIGSKVKVINQYAFSGCEGLTTITIPQAVTDIKSSVFYNCKSLKEVIIADSESELNLGSNYSNPIFSSCPLDTVYIGRNISYKTDKNSGYSPFYRNTTLRAVKITDKETEISENEFYGCTNLQRVIIGDGVTTIGNWAFSGCSSLKFFTFGSEVKTIGQEAFSDCTAVTEITSRAITPPTCGSQALDDINKWECKLYVPKGHLADYQAAEQWKEFLFAEEGDYTIATKYTLTYTVDGEVYKTNKVAEGEAITPEPAPTKEGYIFSGWSTIPATMPAKDLTITGTFSLATDVDEITIKNTGKTTWCSEYDLDFTNVEGVKAYTATGYNNITKTIWLTRVMEVPAGTGLLVKGDAGTYKIPHANVQSAYANWFVGNFGEPISIGETDGDKTNYYLKDGTFRSVNGNANIGKNKAYLQLPTSVFAGTRSIGISYDDEDGTTGIKDLAPALSEGEGEWYTLQGQRVAKPGKGLYIRNGKKVIVR